MRKLLTYILILLLVSCEQSLEVKPKMQILTDAVFSTKENVEAAIVGCYNALQYQHYYGRNLIITGDILSDNSYADGTKLEYYDLDENRILSDNIVVEGIWADIYAAINNVNFVLSKLEEVDFLSVNEKNNYSGQLTFLRALHYYNLVRLYGGVPLKLKPTLDDSENNFLKRSSMSECYNQIIDDLDYAVLNISNTEKYFGTPLSSKALLASVYLTLKDYSNSLDYANDVLNANSYLEPEYKELFDNSVDPSNEILFYIPFSSEDKNRLAEYHFPYQLGGRYENAPSEKLINLLYTNDERRDVIAKEYNDLYYSNKYSDISTGSDAVIVLRVTEMIFIRAEALYNLDSISNQFQVIANLNRVRSRANIDSLPETGGFSIIDTLYKEKQIEFAFEGKRWFDLIRTGKAIEEVVTVMDINQTLLPIPLSEILANPNISESDQNEGY